MECRWGFVFVSWQLQWLSTFPLTFSLIAYHQHPIVILQPNTKGALLASDILHLGCLLFVIFHSRIFGPSNMIQLITEIYGNMGNSTNLVIFSGLLANLLDVISHSVSSAILASLKRHQYIFSFKTDENRLNIIGFLVTDYLHPYSQFLPPMVSQDNNMELRGVEVVLPFNQLQMITRRSI